MVKLSRLLRKKQKRSVKNNIGQFLAIIGIATISVTLFLGLSSNADVFRKRVDMFYEAGNVADIWLNGNFSLRSDEDVKNDETFIKNTIGSDSEFSKRFIVQSTVNSTESYALITDVYPTVNKPLIVDGSVDAQGNYFIIDKRWSEEDNSVANQLKVGSKAIVNIPTSLVKTALYEIKIPGIEKTLNELKTENPEQYDSIITFIKEQVFNKHLKEGKTNIFDNDEFKLDLVVTATMDFGENIQNGSYSVSNYLLSKKYFEEAVVNAFSDTYDSETIIPFFFDYSISDVVKRMLDSITDLNNQYCIKLSSTANEDNVIKTLETNFADSEVIKREDYPFSTVVESDIVQARQLTYVFPFIFFIVAVLVIVTTIGQLVVKERTQIGTMKALGLTRSQILRHYLSLMFFLVGIGLILGAIIGPLLLPGVMNLKYSILYTLPFNVYSFPILMFFILGISLFLVTFLVVYLTCNKELKLSPAASMRPKMVKPLKVNNRSEKKKLKHVSLITAFRNIRLNKLKSILVVIGVAGCTALLVCGFGIDDTLNKGIGTDMEIFYNSDIVLTYESYTYSKKDEIYNKFGGFVTFFDDFSTHHTKLTHDNNSIEGTVFALQGNHECFRVNFDKDKVAISQKVAQDTKSKIGDTITWTVKGVDYSGVVGTIYESFTRHGVLVNTDNPMYASLDSYKSAAWINFKDGTDIDKIGKQIVDNISGFSAYNTKASTIQYINDIMSSISMMTLTVKIFAVLLAVVVLYNLIYLNYKERMRDMATLKVLGFTNKQVARSMIYEVMFLVLIGILVGCLLGYPIEVLVLMINRTPLVEFLYTVTFKTYILSFFISFLTALGLNFLLSLFIKKIKMVESLKAVE